MNNTEVLEIHKNFWEDFKEIYKGDWPKNINGHYTIDTFIKWFRKNPNLNVKVYGLKDGSWKKDGTFVNIVIMICF